MTRIIPTCSSIVLLLLIGTFRPTPAQVQNAANTKQSSDTHAIGGKQQASNTADDAPTNVLSPVEWQRVDNAVERALNWLAAQQQTDGSFPTLPTGQPGITSLCTMAFVSHGHSPGNGQFGPRLERAIDFAISCQKENGLVALVGNDGPEISRSADAHTGTTTAYD